MDRSPQGIGVKIVKTKMKFHHRFEERVLIFRLRKKHLGRNTKRLIFDDKKSGVTKAYLMLQVYLGIYVFGEMEFPYVGRIHTAVL